MLKCDAHCDHSLNDADADIQCVGLRYNSVLQHSSTFQANDFIIMPAICHPVPMTFLLPLNQIKDLISSCLQLLILLWLSALAGNCWTILKSSMNAMFSKYHEEFYSNSHEW